MAQEDSAQTISISVGQDILRKETPQPGTQQCPLSLAGQQLLVGHRVSLV